MAPTRTEIRRETSLRVRRLGLQLGEEIRRLRLDANVSFRAISRATGIDAAYLGRIESGQAHPSNEVLIAVGVALGADVSVRFFSGSGPRIHDRFQAPMLETLLGALHRRWQVELEVPVRQPARGVIDAVLYDQSSAVTVAVEIHSDLQRLEQQIRWGHEKAEGLATRLENESGAQMTTPVSQLLVLRSTTRTRALARQFEATFRSAFPARAADAHESLTAMAPWPGVAILWMHLHGSNANLMRRPPPGVGLGR